VSGDRPSHSLGSSRSSREWIRRIALVVLSPVLFLAAVEFVLWSFDVAPPAGAGRTPTADGFDPDARVAELQGQEGPRVACFGGSSIAGMPLDYKLSMCTLVAGALGRETHIINDSGRGFDSADLMTRVGATCRFPHTLVLIYTGHNEFVNLWRFHQDLPVAAQQVSLFLSRFRFFRLLQTWLGSDTPGNHIGELGDATVSRDEVFARFDQNLRSIVEQCRAHSPVIMSTVVHNPRFSHPLPGMTTRESVRANPTGRQQPDDEIVFRAAPRINRIVRRIAADTGTVLADAQTLIQGRDPADLFWDGVHPKPALHLLLATEMLRLARERGYITAHAEPTITISDGQLRAAAETAAFESMGIDPRSVLKTLRGITEPNNPAAVALGIGLCGFMADDRRAMREGFDRTVQLLKDERYRRVLGPCAGVEPGPDGRVAVASRDGCGLRCLPFPCMRDFMNDAEREELVGAAEAAGEPILTEIVRRL